MMMMMYHRIGYLGLTICTLLLPWNVHSLPFKHSRQPESTDDISNEIGVDSHSSSSNDWSATVQNALQDLMDSNFHVNVRRELHKTPELLFNEEETSASIIRALESLNITNYSTGWGVNIHRDVFDGTGGYGVVVDIGTGKPPCVLLRADMDALPVLEETPVDFRSQNAGKMHACGHDGHSTMLLGAAGVLKRMEELGELDGTVRIMFQPAEEGGAGGKRMREEGVLSMYPPVEHAFAMHLWPTLGSGVIGGRPGALFAGADAFELVVTGVGGHAAMPHLTVDPVVASSAIVLSLQSIVSRHLSPSESGVCSVTMIDAGETFNVIPSKVVLRGTIRALSTTLLLELQEKVKKISAAVAEAHGCSMNATFWRDYYPPTVNDAELFDFVTGVAEDLAIDGKMTITDPTMGAEDFSFIAETVPSVFLFLGQGDAMNPPSHYGLHHPHFAIDEEVLPLGSRLHVELALKTLEKLRREQSCDEA